MLRAPRRLAVVAGLAVTAAVLPVLTAPPAAAVAPDSAVFINEIHYDNGGASDVDERVEVANPGAADLTGWSVVPYNGNGGAAYTPTGGLSGSAQLQSVAISGLQNGSPDGVALVDATGALVQFLSYEGSFTATSGPAAGRLSTDIGVAEAGNEAAGLSLQLTGNGDSYGDFTWTGPADDTPGELNVGQTFTTSSGPAAPAATCPSAQSLDVGTARDLTPTATDADSRVTDATVSVEPAAPSISRSGFAASPSAGSPATATVTIGAQTPPGSYSVTVGFTTDDATPQAAQCSFSVVVTDPDAITPISAVQGAGASTPLNGQRVNIQGVVTSLLERGDVLDGFFVQEESADQDGDSATSEALFVFCRTLCPGSVAVGDVVRVSGVAGENFGMTQVNASAGGSSITVVASGAALPAPVEVALPAAGSTRSAATFEPVEGMVVRFPATLSVSEYFELARYGQLVLTAGGRPYTYTHTARPTAEGYADYLAELNRRRIVLDDDNNDNNDAITGADADEAYAYPSGGLSTTNRFRGGDTITGLTGVLHWSFNGTSGTDAWRVRPIPTQSYVFESVNPRPEAPSPVGGRLRVASFNVLNYFTTVDTTSSSSSGPCGPSASMDCRGADSANELQRQRAKIVDALARVDADVVGLIEIQNDDRVALRDLVNALNARVGAGTYAFVDTGVIGGDAIKVAFIYRPARVSLMGAYAVLDQSVDPRFRDDRNRPALVQSFRENGTGEVFTAAINHLKSKGSACAGDPDLNDGAGNCNVTRTEAARALADFLATDPTGSGDPDVLVLGDLNAYRMEDPIVALEQAGYTDLVERFGGDGAYGYVFDGQLGYLDHALANRGLLPQVTGATEWHANADEPVLLDYNDEVFDEPGEASFERESAALPLYEPNAYRSSDHDAVVVGLALTSPRQAPVTPGQPAPASTPTPTASTGPSATPSASPSSSPSPSVSASPSASVGATGTPSASAPATPNGPAGQSCVVPESVSLDRGTITATGSALVTVRATPNSIVDLYAYTQPSRTFRLVRSAELGADGLAEFRVVPPANTRLYAQQRGCAPTDAAADSVVLNVRTALSLAVRRTGARTYAFSGDSLPARTGGLVVSLFRVTGDGRHVLTAQTRADARTGSWRLDRRFTGSGRFGFVVRTGQDLRNAPGASNVRALTVF